MSDIVVGYDPFTHPICNDCKYRLKAYSCKAFNNIPNDIIFGRNDHSKPLKGQKGDFVFTPKK
jgi:hypothetical protein